MANRENVATARPGHLYRVEVICDGEVFYSMDAKAANLWAAVFTMLARLMAFVCQTSYEGWDLGEKEGLDPNHLFGRPIDKSIN